MKLQNNFTTLEQVEKLTELGLPIESADCYYQQYITLEGERGYNCYIGENMAIRDKLFSYRNCYILPCWSLGRLIEIVLKCLVLPDGLKPSVKFYINDPNMSLMESLIINLTNGRYEYDFSRLDLNEN